MTGVVIAILLIAALAFWALRHHERFIRLRKDHERLGWWYGAEFVPKEDIFALISKAIPHPWVPKGQIIVGDIKQIEQIASQMQVLSEPMTFEVIPPNENEVIRFVAAERMTLRLMRPADLDLGIRIVQL